MYANGWCCARCMAGYLQIPAPNLQDITCPLLLNVLYDLLTHSPCKPNCTVHSQVAGLQGNLYIRRKTGGGRVFSCRASLHRNKLVSLSGSQPRQFSNPHSKPEIQHSLQPAARASLSSPADSAGIVGWLDVISGYAVVCGHTQALLGRGCACLLCSCVCPVS